MIPIGPAMQSLTLRLVWLISSLIAIACLTLAAAATAGALMDAAVMLVLTAARGVSLGQRPVANPQVPSERGQTPVAFPDMAARWRPGR